MRAQLVEVKVDGEPFKALILSDEQLALIAALTGSVGGNSSTTWRKFADEIYWTCIPHVEIEGHPNILHEKVLLDLNDLSIEAKETDDGRMF